MQQPERRRHRLVILGSATMLVSMLAYAGQHLSDWQFTPTVTGSDSTHPGKLRATHRNGQQQRRSPLLHSANTARRRIARDQALEKSPQTERQLFGRHLQHAPLDIARRMPLQMPVSRHQDAALNHDHGGHVRNLLQRPSFMAKKNRIAADSCSSTRFSSLSGAALTNAVASASTSCINDLFGLSGSTAANTFSEVKMVTIADALRTAAARYDGSNRDGILQFILFLRAGYYVQFYDPAVGDYGAALRNAIRPALDAFANSPNFGLVNDTHGEILAEFVTLIDSSTENARYLPVVKRLLDAYNSSFDSSFWMLSAINNAYTVLFRGHQNADFQQLVQADPSIIDTLYGFANRNFNLLGTSNGYLASNAGREMARFLQYTGTTQSLARSRTKALLDRSAVTGPTAALWIGLGEMADHYDAANCSYYGLCNFKETVEAAVLPIHHTCSPTISIRAQSLTAAELDETCAIVSGEEGYFHDMLKTGRIPVANDNNTALEMVVFDSSSDYGAYAGTLFGIDTNNGGMYLEGDPAAPGNQARFIAYEAEWLRPERFEIWNLTHEYIHYLDGRFNMLGDFSAAVSHQTIWWTEGFAEYMSYSYRKLAYTAAQQEAAKQTYPISTIYQNDYSGGQTRIYNWGYLAVRYMFERQPAQLVSLLDMTRSGNYAAYDNYLRGIGTGNDADFMAWLPCVAQPASPGCGAANTAPNADFTTQVNGLSVQFTDASTDVDGRIVSRHWDFGDGSLSNSANPLHAYAQAGSYNVRLTVTDDAGATASSQHTVTVEGLPECTAADPRALGQNCMRSNLTVAADDYAHMYVLVPKGVSTLRITTQGGTGNADLYVNSLGSWATRNYHNYRSTNAGNAETVTVRYPPAGYLFLSLYGRTRADGVTVRVEY